MKAMDAMNSGYVTRQEVIEYIKRKEMIVQLGGLCPICSTGRNQYGECWRGHIIFVNPEQKVEKQNERD